jgi:hypothetical protein
VVGTQDCPMAKAWNKDVGGLPKLEVCLGIFLVYEAKGLPNSMEYIIGKNGLPSSFQWL